MHYCPLRNYIKILAEIWGVYSLLWDTVSIHSFIYLFILSFYYLSWNIYNNNNNKLSGVGLSFIVDHRVSLNKHHALQHNTAQTRVNRPTHRHKHTHGQYLPTACSHPPLQQGSTSQSRDEQNTERKRSGQNTDIRLQRDIHTNNNNNNNNTSTDSVCLTSDLYIQCVWPLTSQSVFDLRHLHTVCLTSDLTECVWPPTFTYSVFDLWPHRVCLISDLTECVWPLTSHSVFDLWPHRVCLTSNLYIQCAWPLTS